MAVGTDRRAKKTAARIEHALLSQPMNTAMPFNPPNYNPGVGVLVAESTLPASPTNPLEYIQSTSTSQEPMTQDLLHSSNKRRSSKTKVPLELRRSSSTPHMRQLALGAPGELSPPNNKPRNKLGYHRTSVACGHCRRRKIRCLLAPDDPSGRCANCIRLKKECNFFPVEHNPDMAQSQTGGSKDGSTGQPATPTNSSPRHASSIPGERVGEFRAPYPGPSSTVTPLGFGFQDDAEIDPRHTPGQRGMPVQHPSYPYPHPIDTQWPPTNSFLPSSTVNESPQSNTSYWRQSPSTTNSVYGSESNVSGGQTPAAMSTSSSMSYGHQDGQWGQQPPFQPPARSMSYGNIEGLQQQYPGQGLGIQHDYPRRTSPYQYPASIDTNSATVHATTMGGATTAPNSAPIVSNNAYYPSSWNSYDPVAGHGPPMPMSGRSMSAQWFAEPAHLDRVQEEAVSPMTYTHSGIPQFYSGA